MATDAAMRLSVNLNPEAALALREISDRKGISITEAVRRAISVYQYISKLDPAQGQHLQVVEGDKVRDVVLV